MSRTKGSTNATVRARDAQIATLLDQGFTAKDIADQHGITVACVNQMRRRRRLRKAMCWQGGKPFHEANKWSNSPGPWSEADELPDDDEPIGPVNRCKCGLVLPCHECISIDYVFKMLNDKRDDNHFVGGLFHSQVDPLTGGSAEYSGPLKKRNDRQRKAKNAHNGTGSTSAPSPVAEPITEGLGAYQKGA